MLSSRRRPGCENAQAVAEFLQNDPRVVHVSYPGLRGHDLRPDDAWATKSRVPLAALLERPVVTVPPTFTAREALDTAVAARGTSYANLVEAANGTIAQALAATGRGVAVVSDDIRFGLVPVGVYLDNVGADVLSIRLNVAWDPRSVAAAEVARLADRLGTWVRDRYEGPGPLGMP